MASKSQVRICEVGLRDGLQNEKENVSLEIRKQALDGLLDAGVQHLELGAFVRADRVPQMAVSKELIEYGLTKYSALLKSKKVSFAALVPNEKGMQEALNSKIPEIAFFTSATEAFAKSNINCTIEESFQRFEPIVKLAKKNKIKIRGYLSVVFGCPFEGAVDPSRAADLVQRLLKMGCYEVSIGDTIGVATPFQVQSFLKKLKRKKIPMSKIAGHFHDTRGTALPNILMCYLEGVRVFDSSVGGLGGCPYAPSATGNVATEDVVYMFDGMKVKTNIDLKKLVQVNRILSQAMNKELPSRVAKTLK